MKIRIPKAYTLKQINEEIEELAGHAESDVLYLKKLIQNLLDTPEDDELLDQIFAIISELQITVEDIRSFGQGKRSLEND